MGFRRVTTPQLCVTFDVTRIDPTKEGLWHTYAGLHGLNVVPGHLSQVLWVACQRTHCTAGTVATMNDSPFGL